MALKPCRECGENVSTSAATCPKCGKAHPTIHPINYLIPVAFLGMVSFAIWSCHDDHPASTTAAFTAPIAAASTAPTQFGQEMEKTSSACASTTEQRKAAANLIQANGYDCAVVDAMCRYVWSGEGATVYCNNGRYSFELVNHGGKWSVTAN